MELVAEGLNFPTGIVHDDDGGLYVAESGLPFGGAKPGGVVSRLEGNGARKTVAEGLKWPVTGVTWHQGWLYISEGGYPGRISRMRLPSGPLEIIVDGLPGFGNYHTNMTVVGPDGWLYFSQGAMTNSGVMGLDSRDLAWLKEIQHLCDIPGFPVTLTGFEAETADPGAGPGARATTAAFAPFGTRAIAGRRIEGRVPCTSSVMRCRLDGSGLELVAWGIRNAYGLGFLPDGRLLATDQGADLRGSRPIANCPDFLYEVKPGAWYGWPDYYGGVPVTDPRFRAAGSPEPDFILTNHAELPAPEKSLVDFEVNACAVKFGVVPAGHKFAGDLIVALFGDERPMTGPAGPRVGRRFVRLSPCDWSLHELKPIAFSRPMDIAFAGGEAYAVDFGEFEFTADKSITARAGSGKLWKLPADFMEV